MRYIELQNSIEIVAIDEEDFWYISQFNWVMSTDGYAKRTVKKEKNGRKYNSYIYMHRELMSQFLTSKKNIVDHINGDRLDNRKSNLRICSSKENNRNRHCTSGASKYKGICYRISTHRWIARIQNGKGKREYLGAYLTEEEAAMAYNRRAKKLFGRFAHLNDIHKKEVSKAGEKNCQ